MKRSRPESYVAPYPAFQAHPGAERPDFVAAVIGVEVHGEGNAEALVETVLDSLDATIDGQPDHVERAVCDDREGRRHHVILPYWPSRRAQEAWLAQPQWQHLINTARRDGLGLYLEGFSAPTSQLDGNYAISNVQYGIGRHSEIREEKYHAYPGSMRDRVPGFLSGESDGGDRHLSRLASSPVALGQVLEIDALPHNLCYIRGGFAWKDASPEEQEVYMRDMYGVYREGAEYLRDNPEESGCITMRMADAVEVEFETGLQSNSIAWFISIESLEAWVRAHPRHLKIMSTIMDYMKRFDFKPKLNLGHEVVVVAEGQLRAIYNNCTSDTGFLPFFKSTPRPDTGLPG